MYAGITRAEQNLLLLQSMIPEGEKLYIWCYDAEGRYIASSCPDPFKKTKSCPGSSARPSACSGLSPLKRSGKRV